MVLARGDLWVRRDSSEAIQVGPIVPDGQRISVLQGTRRLQDYTNSPQSGTAQDPVRSRLAVPYRD